ncbi:MAG: hypothetical protein ABL998_19255, partial [Planctomycetota bacterium]
MYSLLHVGLGPLGQRVVTDLARRQLGKVVAAVDPASGIVGRKLADVVAGLQDGPVVVGHLEEVREWERIRCAVVTTSSDLERCMDTFRFLLARGCSIVSTCEELSWPWLRHPVLAQELHELAVRHRARILGTGINPGFLMDALPVAVTTVCQTVRALRVERYQDAGTRRLPLASFITGNRRTVLAPGELRVRAQVPWPTLWRAPFCCVEGHPAQRPTPVARAGADQSIVYPASAQLRGSVDGWTPLEWWTADGNNETENKIIRFSATDGVSAFGPLRDLHDRTFGYPTNFVQAGQHLFGAEAARRELYTFEIRSGLVFPVGPPWTSGYGDVQALTYD